MRQTFIQWKGTNVCLDVYCPRCKHYFHLDGEFAYYTQCPSCETYYRLGDEVSLTECAESDTTDGCVLRPKEQGRDGILWRQQ